MNDTLAPMLAILGLGWGELVLVLITLMFPVMIVALVIFIVLFVQKNKKTGTQALPAAVAPAPPKRAALIFWSIAAISAAILLVAIVVVRIKAQAGENLKPVEFLQKLISSNIVSATVIRSSQSPLVEIRGYYKTQTRNGVDEIMRFTTKTAMSDHIMDQLERTPDVAIVEKQNVGVSLIPIFPILVFLLILGALIVFIIIRLIVRTTRSTLRAPPINPTPPLQPSLRQCPKCGSILKPDAPEGLCPACLLQHGIATEGGAPPGTPAFTPPPLLELAKLFPQLEILEIIGQGGMGAVYKARQPSLDRFVALKILAPRSGGDLDFAGRFSREARALAKLNHPSIVSVYDYGQVQRTAAPGTPPPTLDPQPLNYFLMEFVDGPNLRQVEQSGKLTPREALQIIPQICAALQFAHDEGIVHRDIKPENVLLDKKGRVKIADFGLAKILGQDADFRLTGARDVMGTPHYMAPEQVEKPQEVDHRADIYSLGVVFYEMLTGELPVGKFDPPSHKVQIDVRLDDVVLRSLANNPDRRYQQVSEVKTELESIAQTPGQIAQKGVNPANQGANNRSRSLFIGLAIAAVAIVGIVIVSIVGFFFFFYARVAPSQRPVQTFPAYNSGNAAGSAPFSATDGADFHLRIFECDETTVDDLIPAPKRQTVSNDRSPRSMSPDTGRPASFATIDTNTFAALLKSIPSPRLLLVDNHRIVSRTWWNPGLATSWSGGRSEEIAGKSWNGSTGGGGFLGMRHNGTKLDVRVDVTANYSLSPTSTPITPHSTFSSHLFYEGEAPNKGALVFLVPFTRQDNSEHYLIVAFEISDAASGNISATPNPWATTQNAPAEQAFIRIRTFDIPQPNFPEVNYYAVIPPGYTLRVTTTDGGSAFSQPTRTETNTYHASWYFQPVHAPRVLTPEELKLGHKGQPLTLDTDEQIAAERQSLSNQLQTLKSKGLISIVAAQPKLLFSVTNGVGDIWQGFLELVETGTNPPLPINLATPPPVRPPPSLSVPGNVIRPLRSLPQRMTPEEQTAVIEIERAKTKMGDNPIAHILPPTLLAPAINPTNGLSPTNTPPLTNAPAGSNQP